MKQARRASDRKVRSAKKPRPENAPMLDLIMLAIGLGFFALSIAYGQTCEKL